jgi:hypothetical protein
MPATPRFDSEAFGKFCPLCGMPLKLATAHSRGTFISWGYLSCDHQLRLWDRPLQLPLSDNGSSKRC